jgi:hypothetical protein
MPPTPPKVSRPEIEKHYHRSRGDAKSTQGN